jgi:hypothetical protein
MNTVAQTTSFNTIMIDIVNTFASNIIKPLKIRELLGETGFDNGKSSALYTTVVDDANGDPI